MAPQKLTKKEYETIHKILSEKRAIRELFESLKAQLSLSILQEDEWWKKVSKKYELDTVNNAHRINHETQEIIEVPRPQSSISHVQAKPRRGVKIKERTPEMDALLTEEELQAMRESMKAINSDN